MPNDFNCALKEKVVFNIAKCLLSSVTNPEGVCKQPIEGHKNVFIKLTTHISYIRTFKVILVFQNLICFKVNIFFIKSCENSMIYTSW